MMEQHLLFWRTLATGLGAGVTLQTVLDRAGTQLKGTELEAVAESLAESVTAGQTLSSAMSRHSEVFTRAVTTMVKAGELGGVLDVIAARIVNALEEGCLGVRHETRQPGGGVAVVGVTQGRKAGIRPEQDSAARFWRALGWLISSGVPVLEGLDIVREEALDDRLREAGQVIQKSIREGGSIAGALAAWPELFPEEVRVAVQLGEERGELDKACLQIGEALWKGDLAPLVPDPPLLEAARENAGKESAPRRYVNQLLLEAIAGRASDIHLDPGEGGNGRVRLRVDGALRDVEPPEPEIWDAVIGRIKIMANMDVAERRRPQDGRIMLNHDGKEVDLRVSIVPVVWGERIVARLLVRQPDMLTLESIGFMDNDLKTVRDLCRLPHGMVICNGPTGSGKTTLLYAMLFEVNRDRCAVISIEDPVEYRLPGVAQIQVNPTMGLTFARALRAVLRQAPDVIMVGEIRDLETLEGVAQTALTGHLVLTTLHANTSVGAVRRLLDIGLEPFLVNGTLAAIVSQRLVRLLCAKCKQPMPPAPEALPPEAAEFVRSAASVTFYGPKGCPECRGTGYRGRTAIHEMLIPDDGFRAAVAAGAGATELRRSALAAGMKAMLTDGLEKAAEGLTSVEEVCRVAPRGAEV